ncbi:hypothetical protein TNCV_751051 [Trichonephila clavipes]|nr:hypothetical protein TNCV_751051 [Trichonephila clavipes]
MAPSKAKDPELSESKLRKFTPELELLCSLLRHTPSTRDYGPFSHINAAAKRSIPRVKRRNDWVPFWKDTNIENLINERDKTKYRTSEE